MNVVDLYNMDCRDAMSLFLPDNSVDAIVCDPPYGLSFMGKKWDYDVPGVDIWAECLRVLKPGGPRGSRVRSPALSQAARQPTRSASSPAARRASLVVTPAAPPDFSTRPRPARKTGMMGLTVMRQL